MASFRCGDVVVNGGSLSFNLYEEFGKTKMSGYLEGNRLKMNTKFGVFGKGKREYKRAQPLPPCLEDENNSDGAINKELE